MTKPFLNKDGHICRTATDVDDGDAHVPLFRAQDGAVAGQRFQNQFININPMRHDTLHQIVDRRAATGDNMRIHLQAVGVHAHRLLHMALPIDCPLAGNGVNHFLVLGESHGACAFQSALHIIAGNTLAAVDGGDPFAVQGANMAAGNANIGADHPLAHIRFATFHRFSNRSRRLLHIHHHATPDATAGCLAFAHNAQRQIAQTVMGDASGQSTYFGRANINGRNNFLHGRASLSSVDRHNSLATIQ